MIDQPIKFILKIVFCVSFITLQVSDLHAQKKSNVESITLQGTKRIKESYLYKIIRIKPGNPLDSFLINEDISRLKRLPSITHAYFSVDSAHNVVYTIEESFTLIPSFNLYTSTQNNLAARVGVYEYNLLGRNIQAGGFYQRDVFNSFGVNIRAPHLFNRHFGVAVNASQLSTLEPVFLGNSDRSDYQYTNTAIEMAALVEANFNNKFLLGVTLFNEKYEYENGATDAAVPLNLDVNKILYTIYHSYNNIEYFYQYLSGLNIESNLQYVRANNLFLDDFVVGRVDFKFFKRYKTKLNLANRLRVGLSTNSSSPFAPFAVDNNVNLRGVGNVVDRGTAVVILNTELRHTWLEKKWLTIQGNAFVDMGTWRNPGGSLNDLISPQNFRLHPGVGIRLINKRIVNAVLRLDYGIGVLQKDKPNGFVIGIGQYF